MNRCLLITILTAVFVSPAVLAQEPFEGEPPPEEEMEREIYMHKMQLEQRQHEAQMNFGRERRQLELKKQNMELQQREAQMDFDQKMREIELEKHHIALEREQRPQKHPACFAHCSGIWIVIALLTGLLGALVYAVVRLGDSRQTQS